MTEKHKSSDRQKEAQGEQVPDALERAEREAARRWLRQSIRDRRERPSNTRAGIRRAW
jgi:hypothetical protein